MPLLFLLCLLCLFDCPDITALVDWAENASLLTDYASSVSTVLAMPFLFLRCWLCLFCFCCAGLASSVSAMPGYASSVPAVLCYAPCVATVLGCASSVSAVFAVPLLVLLCRATLLLFQLY